MRPIEQEHLLGCGVACVAFLTEISYQDAFKLFEEGDIKITRGFYCWEIVQALQNAGLDYQTKYVAKNPSVLEHTDKYIIYIRKSPLYPGGHFLARKGKEWMDPWSNFPELRVKADFREILPGDAQYAIIPK